MKKIIIIGGGVAGLSTGIYAQKAGFASVIYEQHKIAGGECTGWERGGFHIDGCIHWLMGTKDGTGLNKIWREVGALGDVEIYQPDYFTVADVQGKKVTLHKDLEMLMQHLLEIAPEDEDEIIKLCKYIKAFYAFEPPCEKPLDLMNIFELTKFVLSMRKVGGLIRKMGKLTCAEYLQNFKNPAIKEVLHSIVPENYSAYTLMSSLGTFCSGNGGKPMGGSRALAQRMEAKYKSLGGKMMLGTKVNQILVEDGSAKGIVLADGTEELTDYIVPACDIHITLQKLLKGEYVDPEIELRDQDPKTYPLQTSVQLALGVDADLSAYADKYVFLTQDFSFQDQQLNKLSLKNYSYEPSFAPAGKTLLQVYFHANYHWWKEKHRNLTEYRAEKVRLAREIIARLEKHFPELSGRFYILDITTPITHERYCGAYQGSWMAFGPTPKGKQLMHNGKVKDLKNLYLAGQWLMPPGGLPTAVVTGKWSIQRICRQEKIKLD